MAETARQVAAKEKRDAVLALVRQGLAFSAVATATGATRSAVAGHVDRARARGEDLGSIHKPGSRRERSTPAPADPPPARQEPVPQAPVVVAPPPPPPRPAPVRLVSPPPPTRPAAVVYGAAAAVRAVTSRECRFPIGEVAAEDFRFCCALVPDTPAVSIVTQPYCSEHRVKVVNPAQVRRSSARA